MTNTAEYWADVTHAITQADAVAARIRAYADDVCSTHAAGQPLRQRAIRKRADELARLWERAAELQRRTYLRPEPAAGLAEAVSRYLVAHAYAPEGTSLTIAPVDEAGSLTTRYRLTNLRTGETMRRGTPRECVLALMARVPGAL